MNSQIFSMKFLFFLSVNINFERCDFLKSSETYSHLKNDNLFY